MLETDVATGGGGSRKQPVLAQVLWGISCDLLQFTLRCYYSVWEQESGLRSLPAQAVL